MNLRRPSMLGALGALLLACCSASSPSPVIGATSGMRLRAWVDDGGGGARRFLFWYDTELDTDCTFAQTPDGTYRCLDARGARVVYADAACTDALVLSLRDIGGLPHYIDTFATAAPSTCRSAPNTVGGIDTAGDIAALGGLPAIPPFTAATAVHAIGAPRTAPAALFTISAAGTCTPMTLDAHATFADIGEEVPFDRFASATIEESTRGGVRVRELVASDGARQTVGLVHADTGEDCALTQLADGLRCAPAAAASEPDLFGDAACSEPIAYVRARPGCAAPTYMLRSATLCDPPELRPLGARDDTPFTDASGTCQSTLESGPMPSTAGPASSDDELDRIAPPLTLRMVGTDALHLEVIADEAGGVIGAGRWIAADGEPCTMISLIGGDVSCTHLAYTGTWFADAACSVPLVVDTSCHAPALAYDSPTRSLHIRGAAFEGTPFQPMGATCVAGATSLPLFRLGDVVSPSTQPTIHRTID